MARWLEADFCPIRAASFHHRALFRARYSFTHFLLKGHSITYELDSTNERPITII